MIDNDCVFCDLAQLRAADVCIENASCIYASTRDPRDPPDYGLRFCPKCAGQLEGHQEAAGEPAFPTCLACGFVYYYDPKLAAE